MSMSELSQDLLEEILCRVPAISLKKLRSTCKLWNSLFIDKRVRNELRRVTVSQVFHCDGLLLICYTSTEYTL
ncbi:putative F-box domain-containing protein [Arabidopsis thaliana]